MDDQRQRSVGESLAAGFLAGFLGGELFLAAGLLRHPGELFATSPTPAFALWVLLRSIALYGLLFGALGLALGGLAHRVAALRRPPLAVFAPVSGAMVAVTTLAYLTAWWQLDVLGGLARGLTAKELAAELPGLLVAYGIPQMNGLDLHPDLPDRTELEARLFGGLYAEGFLLKRHGYNLVSYAHTEEQVQECLAACRRVAAALVPAGGPPC